MRRRVTTLALILSAVLPVIALAETGDVETVPFEGGALTITEVDGGEKQLAFDGRLLGSNYRVYLDRIVEVAGQKVALFSMGEGGNACGPGTLIVWRGPVEVDADYVGGDCGGPPPAVTQDAILFVPYLNPGENGVVERWTPQERLTSFGRLTYAPQDGSTWADIDLETIHHPLDFFRNADFYAAAAKLLGDDLADYVTGLRTAGMPEKAGNGMVVAKGCVPHNCGGSDSFLAIDLVKRTLYLAQQSEGDTPRAWPALAAWPQDVVKLMQDQIGR